MPLGLLAGRLPASPSFAALSVDLGSGTATISGTTAGGAVAPLAVFRDRVKEAGARVTRIDETLAADSDGTVVREAGREIPVSSIWIVVDVELFLVGRNDPSNDPKADGRGPHHPIRSRWPGQRRNQVR